jgi:hypothetical protein
MAELCGRAVMDVTVERKDRADIYPQRAGPAFPECRYRRASFSTIPQIC